MITKILNNNLLDRTDNVANMLKALVGSWGVSSTDNGNIQNIYSGRTVMTYIYNGTTLQNLSDNYPCIAIVVYTDGTSDIKSISKKSTLNTEKEINIAIMIAQMI